MYKSAGYQINPDDKLQYDTEKAIAPSLLEQHQRNLQAFRQHIPSINQLLANHTPQQYSVFCNKFSELNIVDFSIGQAFYRQKPRQEIDTELRLFCQSAPVCFINEHATGVEPLPQEIELLVMFGLGAGYQLETLMNQYRIRNLIIYEPSLDILACSVQLADWHTILEQAAVKGCNIFLQAPNDGSSFFQDFAELLQQTKVNCFYLYRHYSHPLMDAVFNEIQHYSGDYQSVINSRQHFVAFNSLDNEVEMRHGNTIATRQWHDAYKDDALYQRNLKALQHYYPQVYAVINKHVACNWKLVTDDSGKPNLWNKTRRALFYVDAEQDSQQLVADFCQHPFQDDVLVGHKPGYKLRSYLHNQQVTKLLPILERSVKKRNFLPDTIDSLIVFGIGLGQHLTLLTQQHQIRHWYICEPNLDFFAASLYVTDWALLFEQAEQQNNRIYLNLGGDGSEYFQDLMRQFYQVGAYSIANTYLLTSYYGRQMNMAISELRSNLKVVLAIGEYFDHARFGIAHTYGNFQGKARLLQRGCAGRRYSIQQVPVFIIGNGPSLDGCFDYLRQYQEQAIIISCGTALKALYQQGIKPDFHAELEQNRATYQWVTQVNDLEWLKSIRLLSVNGIHPDTMALFSETLLCFKDGEASTQMFQRELHKLGMDTESLSYSYPTVTNMVLNMMLKIGFKTLYLMGVDLGFVDIKYHHSKHSAYYGKDGKAIYDYQKEHGGGLPVAGNFMPTVFTKPEFDVSRKLLEQAISDAAGKYELYNCSNGVRIKGTIPLHPDNILLSPLSAAKTALLQQFIEQAYYVVPQEVSQAIVDNIDKEKLRQTIDDWQRLLADDVTTEEQAKKMMEQQWHFLLRSRLQPDNPAFVLFNGSANYFSSILLKLAVTNDLDDNSQLIAFNEVLVVWREYLTLALEQYLAEPLKYDEVFVTGFS